MNFKKLTSRFLAILSIVVLTITGFSCTDTETTNTTGFAIYYYSLTDIGPSMNAVIEKPTYTGGEPTDFVPESLLMVNHTHPNHLSLTARMVVFELLTLIIYRWDYIPSL